MRHKTYIRNPTRHENRNFDDAARQWYFHALPQWMQEIPEASAWYDTGPQWVRDQHRAHVAAVVEYLELSGWHLLADPVAAKIASLAEDLDRIQPSDMGQALSLDQIARDLHAIAGEVAN
jgi:hypothetical protein